MTPSIIRSIRESQEIERRHWEFMDAYWVQWNKECVEFRQAMKEIVERNNAAKGA